MPFFSIDVGAAVLQEDEKQFEEEHMFDKVRLFIDGHMDT